MQQLLPSPELSVAKVHKTSYVPSIQSYHILGPSFLCQTAFHEDKYVKYFGDLLRNATPVYGADAALKAYNIDGDVRIQYKDEPDFVRIANQFGIFQEWKDGIPRTSYKGVVVFRYQTSRRVFLVGPDSYQLLGIKLLH